jgi:ubiquitin carboxyl-terminal hydrolase 5/13
MLEETNACFVQTVSRPFGQVPGYGDRVRKTECVLSFDTPESPAGLFVSLSDFQGFGSDFVGLNSDRTGAKLYLNIKWTKIPKPTPPPEEASAPTKLAIGVEGGFQVDEEQFDYEKVGIS